jgi:cytoskeleton protein RodZ
MQTIGERLEEARKRKGISIREAAEATKIRGDYLQKFESNQFDLNLAEIYVRGFLRSYAHFLKLPAEKIVNDLNGLGFGTRPKAPSREVYGRMDLSVATSDEISASGKPDGDEAGGEEPGASPVRRTAPAFNRPAGSGMPPGPLISPTLVIKGGIGLGALIVVVLLIWGISAIFGGKKDAATSAQPKAPAAQQAAAVTEKNFRLIAVQTVQVQVNERSADGNNGPVILPNTTLLAGDSRVVPWKTAVNITASEGANLQIEVNGNRQGIGFTGYKQGWLPAP